MDVYNYDGTTAKKIGKKYNLSVALLVSRWFWLPYMPVLGYRGPVLLRWDKKEVDNEMMMMRTSKHIFFILVMHTYWSVVLKLRFFYLVSRQPRKGLSIIIRHGPKRWWLSIFLLSFGFNSFTTHHNHIW